MEGHEIVTFVRSHFRIFMRKYIIRKDSCCEGDTKMPYWLRKCIVGFVAVLTFGTVVPPLHPPPEKSDSSKSGFVSHGTGTATTAASEQIEEIIEDKVENQEDDSEEDILSKPWKEVAVSLSDSEELKQQLAVYTVQHAEKQGIRKFGASISDRVGDEYRDVILPKIGQVMETLGEKIDGDSIKNLVVTENPSDGYGERIFHIYNEKTGEDLVRFDVRRERPPKDGYWFNFHYHTNSDQFKKHHDLGKIYWDKNTPPKWMA
jgi:hypothetical protein